MSKRVDVLIRFVFFFFVFLCGGFRPVPSGVGPGRVDRPAAPQPAAARGHPDPPPAGRGRGLRRQQRGAQRPQLLPSGDLIFAIARVQVDAVSVLVASTLVALTTHLN